jgi:hypothetical protein
MGNAVYAVTSAFVADRFFPQLQGGFTVNTRPTSTTISTMIGESAADVNGVLGLLSITQPTSVEAQAYAWCQYTVALGAAFRAARGMASGNPEAAKAWEAEYKARLTELKGSPSMLTDAIQASNPTTGVRSWVRDLSLDRGDSTDYTDNVRPTFRVDDDI